MHQTKRVTKSKKIRLAVLTPICAAFAASALPVVSFASEVLSFSHSPSLTAELNQVLERMPESYTPRTEHFKADGSPKYTNRLISETSPYLLQHAHNPVDWRAWNDKTMLEAGISGKPIFLSIGYATCHWCHVMERESFENEDIATFINENFIPVKVDREQRPDIDQIYMTAVQITSDGSGGWPLTAFLLPDGRPFYAGTYSPPDYLQRLMENSVKALVDQQMDVELYATDVARAIEGYMETVEAAETLNDMAVEQAADSVLASFEPEKGGFSNAPKFPNEPVLDLLLTLAGNAGTEPEQSQKLLQAVTHTLKQMQQGGIHDQVGGGFHRYSTDEQWLVPHFEKMLYNQAQLAKIYTKAFELTGDLSFKRTATRIFDFVLREMTSPQGTFYSALDADNLDADGKTVEGEFYTWNASELAAALDPIDLERALILFNMTPDGNFEGRNIPNLSPAISRKEFDDMDRLSPVLIDFRNRKNRPLRDEKIILAWNAMMIEAFAFASHVLQNEDYANIALRAANSLFETNFEPETATLRRLQTTNKVSETATTEQPSKTGQLDDYASFILALISLYDISGDFEWMDRAGTLTESMIDRFMDEDDGSFFMVDAQTADASALITRPRETFDGAKPSGSSLALGALAEFYQRTGDPSLRRVALEAWTHLSGNALRLTRSHATALLYGLQLQNLSNASLTYGGMGTTRLKTSRDGDVLTVSMELEEGWHANSHTPLQSDYIPTVLESSDESLSEIIYPEQSLYRPAFSEEDLSVYSGSLDLKAKVETKTASRAQLQIQVCSDEICLPPQAVELRVPAVPHWPEG